MSETKPKVINGISFEISQPYTAGHQLTELEAKVLNQTRSENIGNNVRQKVKDLQDEGASVEDIRAVVAEVDANYEFRSVSEGTSRSVDPYEREARRIARDLLKEHLASTGRKITVAPEGETEDEWKDKIAAQVDKIAANPEVLATAKKNVDAKKKQGEKLLEAIGSVSV